MKNSFRFRIEPDAGRRGDRIELFCCDVVHSFARNLIAGADEVNEQTSILLLALSNVRFRGQSGHGPLAT